MTARRRRRVLAIAVRTLVAAVVVGCVVAAGIAMRDRSRVEASAHRAAHGAAADLQALRDGRSRVARLEVLVASADRSRSRDEVAIVHTITALDQLQTLRDRIELAEFELERARDVDAVQDDRLRILRACVRSLDEVRSHLVAGDSSGATAWLAEGRSSCQQAEALAEGMSAAHPFDFPDPFILRVDSSYYAFATNGPAGTVQVVESSDLADWQVRGSALSSVPEWAQPGFTWAPSAIRTFDAGFVLFYTVRDRASGKQCITRATAAHPAGPYVDSSTGPLVCQLGQAGSIDPSPYVDAEGNLHLVWKSEGETAGGGAQIWTAPLAPDGSRMAWFPTMLLTVDHPWEGRTIEGPSMALAGGQWVLLYSGNRWDSGDYATGYAVCDGPQGPCHKPADNVVLRSDAEREGPGGAELFRTADGQLKVAYAAWDAGEVGVPNPRRLHLGTASMTPLGLRIS